MKNIFCDSDIDDNDDDDDNAIFFSCSLVTKKVRQLKEDDSRLRRGGGGEERGGRGGIREVANLTKKAPQLRRQMDGVTALFTLAEQCTKLHLANLCLREQVGRGGGGVLLSVGQSV